MQLGHFSPHEEKNKKNKHSVYSNCLDLHHALSFFSSVCHLFSHFSWGGAVSRKDLKFVVFGLELAEPFLNKAFTAFKNWENKYLTHTWKKTFLTSNHSKKILKTTLGKFLKVLFSSSKNFVKTSQLMHFWKYIFFYTPMRINIGQEVARRLFPEQTEFWQVLTSFDKFWRDLTSFDEIGCVLITFDRIRNVWTNLPDKWFLHPNEDWHRSVG